VHFLLSMLRNARRVELGGGYDPARRRRQLAKQERWLPAALEAIRNITRHSAGTIGTGTGASSGSGERAPPARSVVRIRAVRCHSAVLFRLWRRVLTPRFCVAASCVRCGW
jgi:hypothetical protein